MKALPCRDNDKASYAGVEVMATKLHGKSAKLAECETQESKN